MDRVFQENVTQLCGMHINEDWFIPEIIDPEDRGSSSAGRKRRTCCYLSWKRGASACPIQNRRHDQTDVMSRVNAEEQPCRMENLSGRADDMLVIRGVNVFPTQIEEVLLKIDGDRTAL